MLTRIAQFRIGDDGLRIEAMKVLERRNEACDGVTTGVVVRNELYYVANPQIDQSVSPELQPLKVFSVRVSR